MDSMSTYVVDAIALIKYLADELPENFAASPAAHSNRRVFRCVYMDLESWGEFLKLDIQKLHDRMICSIARAKKAAVITGDESMLKRREIESVRL